MRALEQITDSLINNVHKNMMLGNVGTENVRTFYPGTFPNNENDRRVLEDDYYPAKMLKTYSYLQGHCNIKSLS